MTRITPKKSPSRFPFVSFVYFVATRSQQPTTRCPRANHFPLSPPSSGLTCCPWPHSTARAPPRTNPRITRITRKKSRSRFPFVSFVYFVVTRSQQPTTRCPRENHFPLSPPFSCLP